MKEFDRLFNIVKKLRGENGCPWDKEQTAASMTNDLVEEVYETIEAIEENKKEDIREELGDLFFLVIFISRICEENRLFSIKDVLNDVSDKLVRRHPHVFGNLEEKNIDKILVNWESIKIKEAKNKSRKSYFDGIPKRLPEIQRFNKILEKARRAEIEIKPVTKKDLSDSINVYMKKEDRDSFRTLIEKLLIYAFLQKFLLPSLIRGLCRKNITYYKSLLKDKVNDPE